MSTATFIDPHSSAWVVEALAHNLWQGTLIAGLSAAAAFTLRNRSAQARYGLYCAGLFLTAACMPLNLWLLAATDRSESPAVSSGALFDSADPRGNQVRVERDRGTLIQTREPVNGGLTEVVPINQETMVSIAVLPQPDTGATLVWEQLSSWLAFAYALGMATMTLRLLLGLYGSQRLRASAQPIVDPRVQEMVVRLGERFRSKVLPVVASSAGVAMPVVVGVIKPAILLPIGIFNELTAAQVESLLLHELAHIRRYDHVVNLLQRIVETMLFFHPAVWWLSHKISIEREHCCDDLAICWGSEPCDYAESLVRVSELRYRMAGLANSSAATLAASGNRPSQLRGRVLRVLGMPLPGPSVGLTRVGLASFITLAISSAVLLAALPERQVEMNPEPAEQVETESRGRAKIAGRVIVPAQGIAPGGWFYSGSKSGNNSAFSSEGRFEDTFECEVAAGTINLRFFPDDDYAPVAVGPFELKGGQTLDSVRVELTPGHTQTVIVLDKQNEPIAGATVVAHPLLNGSTNGPNLPHETNELGKVRLEHVAPNTRYEFHVEASGFQKLRTEPLRIPHGGEDSLMLRMVRAQPATGIVRFPDGSPSAGAKLMQLAEIESSGHTNMFPQPGLLTTADSQGRFDLDSLRNDSKYVLLVEALDFNRVVVADIAAGKQDLQIVFPERHDLLVRVIGDIVALPKRKGKPYVKIYQRFDGKMGDQSFGALLTNYATIEPTDNGGQAIFRGLAIDLRPDAGPQQVEVMLGQDESTTQHVEIARDADRATLVEFDLRTEDHEVTQPAAQGDDSSATGPDSRSAEAHTTAAEANGDPPASQVNARSQVAGLDYSRRSPRTVRVLTPDGDPASGASFQVVWWRNEEGDYDYSTSEPTQKTNARGEVELPVPHGAARVSIRVEAAGYAARQDELSLAGEPVVRLDPGRIVRVLAINPDGQPLKDAVPLIEDCRTFPQEFKAVPQRPGMFESPVVALDRRWMRVVAAGEDGPLVFSKLLDLDDPSIVDEDGIVVAKLQPGVRLKGKLDASVPRPVKIGCVDLYIQQGEQMRIIDGEGWSWQDAAPVRADGTFEFPSLPPGGHVQLFALVEGHHSSRPTAAELQNYLEEHNAGDASLLEPARSRDFLAQLFPLPADADEINVVLPCVPTAAADVRVVDPLGRPLTEATVQFSPNCFFLGPQQSLPAYERFLDSARTHGSSVNLNDDPLKPVREWALASFYRVPTNAEGVAKAQNLPADQRLTCRVEAEGFVVPSEPGSSPDFDSRHVLIESKRGATVRRTITMERPIVRTTRDLAIVDKNGKPVAGITVTASEIAFDGAEDDWQFWSVQRFGEIPTAETDEGGQLRFDLPREIDDRSVAAIRVIVQGRVGPKAYVQRQRAAIPPEDDGGVLVLTESNAEPLRPGAFREVSVEYVPLSRLETTSPLDLLAELEQAPSITVLKRLLANSEFEEAVPLSFRAERNLLSAFNDEPTPVARLNLAERERVVVMCYVRPQGATWDTKPKLRFPPEAAFVFDAANGKLVKMVGGWASASGDYCSAMLTDLGTPGDYFIETSAFEHNGPFEYRQHWTRLGAEDQPMLTVLGYANATSWSAGSQMGPLAAEYGYTGYSFNSRNIDDKLPGVTASGALAPRKIYWDRHAQSFVGPIEMSFEGTPLYRVVPEQSAAFEPLVLKPDELFVAGGRGRYNNWHLWDVIVPGEDPAELRLSLINETDAGENLITSRHWSIAPGMHSVQLHLDQSGEGDKPNLEVRVDEKKYEETIDAPPINFAGQDSAPGEPVVRQGERSVVLLNYPTTEAGVRMVATLILN